MRWNLTITWASKLVNNDPSSETRSVSSLEELDALLRELKESVVISIGDSRDVELIVYDDYLE